MRRPRIAAPLLARWRRLPPRTIRLRLTLIYGGLFIVCGTALLAINYALASAQYTSAFFIRSGNSNVRIQLAISGKNGPVVPQPGKNGVGSNVVHSLAGSLTGLHSLAGGPAGRALLKQGAGGSVSQTILGTALPHGFVPPSARYLAALADGQSHAARGALLVGSGIALAIMALLAIGLGWAVAGRALRPLREITAAAQEISASNLHRRLALRGPDDELRRLARTFDALLERLEAAFGAQRQFAANVSHELRTPLTYERTLIEVALANPDLDAGQLRAVCEELLRSGERQERLIDALLELSRGQRGIEAREPVDLAELARRVLAEAGGHGLSVETSLGPASITGDPRLLERLVANLVANALVHNMPGGWIRVVTATSDGHVTLTVANSGPVVGAADIDRLFEPFERLAGARTNDPLGVGLGLSIVRAIAEAHAATVRARPLADGGLEVTVTF